MTILRLTSKKLTTPSQQNTGRRSFIWKAGAALSMGLAAAVPGMAKTGNNDKDLKRRIARLEDEQAIRKLHRTYEDLLDSGRYAEVAALFTDTAEVLFNGGIYQDKKGINRLYRDHFSAGLTGKRMAPPPGFQSDTAQQPEITEVAADGKSATARFPYSMQVGAPLPGDSVLVQMARLHGEGIRKWWEGGIYDISYVKDARDSGWKMTRLEHRVLARADYQPGMARAKPISVPPFDKVYPEEATGPDRLITT